MRSLELLSYLKAIDEKGEITQLGKLMNKLPLDPQLSRMLIESCNLNCSKEVLSIACMLSGKN
jgi:pre-mRNA-splicing factor ATP-dependent RNA helicase DHX15/PRP43